jgi:membrane protease YdiL (CAAX protease family)
LGQVPQVDLAEVPTFSLFAVQILLLVAIVVWWSAAWLGVDEGTPELPVDGALPSDLQAGVPPSGWRRRLEGLGLWCARPLRELGLGLVAGVLAWGGVLVAVIVVAAVAMALGADGFVSEPPSEIIVWMVELGIGTRLLISLSAGVAEELFFRGYLQPRLGILPSTLFFVAAHAGYGRPFMLLGVCLLSLLYGLLSRWRGSIWAAISAHFLFDGLQLLVVIPAALRAAEGIP